MEKTEIMDQVVKELIPGLEGFHSEQVGLGYILVEERQTDIGQPPTDPPQHIIFMGTHHNLNLYQIWYNAQNPGIVLRSIDAFVPMIRRREDVIET